MAHSCPECGSQCYCNGDIDDILLEGTDEEEACTCCSGGDDEDDEVDYDDQDCEDGIEYGGEELG